MVHTRSNREIEKISKSCQIVADTLIMLEDYVVDGACVSDLDKMAEEYIISKGARPAFKGYMGFPSTLCVSIEDAVVHGIPGKNILKQGQIVGTLGQSGRATGPHLDIRLNWFDVKLDPASILN